MRNVKPTAPATCTPPPNRDYTKFLNAAGLKGKRIGVPRAFYYDAVTVPGLDGPRGGLNDAQRAAMDEAVAVLRAHGSVIVDPADIPSVVDPDPANNLLRWGICGEERRGADEGCSIVFKYGMKRDFNAWLASLGAAAPFKTLTDLRFFNLSHANDVPRSAIKFGQSLLDISDEMDLAADKAKYTTDRAKDVALGGAEGIDAALKAARVDALIFPGGGGAGLAAKPGYPTVIVPFARIPNAPTPAFPAGFNAKPAPYGVSFTGTACSEPRLIELAYAFEQATRRRVAPTLFP